MKIEERFNRVLAGLSHTGYTTEIEKCEARIFIEELYKQNQKYKEVIDKLKEYMKEFIFEPLLVTEDRKLIMYNENLKNFEDILKEVE